MFYKKTKRYVQYDIKDAKYDRIGHNGLKRDRNNRCAAIKRQLNRLVRAAGKLELHHYDHSKDTLIKGLIEYDGVSNSYFGEFEDDWSDFIHFNSEHDNNDHDYTYEEKWSDYDDNDLSYA